MRNQQVEPRPGGYSATPVIVSDGHGREVATLRSQKALISGELLLLAGDTVIVGKIRVVS
jgi:hypothetical protein